MYKKLAHLVYKSHGLNLGFKKKKTCITREETLFERLRQLHPNC